MQQAIIKSRFCVEGVWVKILANASIFLIALSHRFVAFNSKFNFLLIVKSIVNYQGSRTLQREPRIQNSMRNQDQMIYGIQNIFYASFYWLYTCFWTFAMPKLVIVVTVFPCSFFQCQLELFLWTSKFYLKAFKIHFKEISIMKFKLWSH